jgi:hypothetical protein
VIPDVDSLVHSEWPKAQVGLVWPVENGVEKHGSSHLRNGADSTLRYSFLMVGTDATEINGLVHGSYMIFVGLGREDPIVGAIALDGNATSFSCPAFESFLGF